MKKSNLMPSGLALMALGVFSVVHPLTAAEGTDKSDTSRWLRLHCELREKLTTAGQTNLVAEIDQLVETMLADNLTYQVRHEVGVLRRLREGNTNIIETLESGLDSDIVMLTDFGQPGPGQVKALNAAKEYRAKYPRKTDNPETDADVARALSQTKAK